MGDGGRFRTPLDARVAASIVGTDHVLLPHQEVLLL
jgi:hypothetical protein